MPAPTTSILLNSTTPAAPGGNQNVKPQSDGATPQQSISFYPQKATASLLGVVKPDGTTITVASDGTLSAAAPVLPIASVGVAIDGGGSAIATGQIKMTVQIPFAGTIVGWAIMADQAGSISVDVWKKASSPPPSAPSIPASADKISASAPAALSSAQTAGGGSSAISTWTTAVAEWDVMGFDITAAATVTAAMIEIFVERS